jgi:hypothetical protein
MSIAFTTPKAIEFYALCALRSALSLNIKTGMIPSRGVNPYAIAKRKYGLKGNKEKVLAQLDELIEQTRAGAQPGINRSEG